jgi:phospholipid/cholesterol/gamma-HCH transport system substrate-binding protein
MAAVAWFFLGRGIGGYPLDVTFKDAQGTKEGADVRLYGVKIGSVTEVDVNPAGGARLHMSIFPERRIPKGAVYTLTSGGLLGEMYVQIMPDAKHPQDGFLPSDGKVTLTIKGQDLVTFDDLRVKAADLGDEADSIAKNINRISARLAKLADDPYFEKSARHTVGNVEDASRQAALAAEKVNATLSTAAPQIESMLADVKRGTQTIAPLSTKMQKAVDNVTKITDNVDRMVLNFNETITFLRSTIKDTLDEANVGPSAKTTLANIAEASERFKLIAADAQKITADLASTGEANSRIGEVVMSVKQVSDKASALLDRISGVADKAGKAHAPRVNIVPQFEAFQTGGSEASFRADVNLAIPRGADSALILGVRDLGEGNKLNFQNATTSGTRTQFRYGFHDSRLGVGWDYALTGGHTGPGLPLHPGDRTVSVDLYRPNDLQLDVYGKRQINDNLGITLGIEDLLHDGHPGFGITYSK